MIRLLCLTALVLAGSLFADPRQWDAEGLFVYGPREIVDFARATRDDGTTLVVWSQSLGDEQVVLGQLLAADGAALWPAGGLLLAQGDHKASYPDVTAVEGGWVIVWGDMQIIAGYGPNAGWDGYGSLRAIKIDDSGTPLWTGGRAGHELTTDTPAWGMRSQFVLPSGDGAIVLWYNTNRSALRLTATGEPAWPEPLEIASRLHEDRSDFASDGNGGVLLLRRQGNEPQRILYVNKLLADGTYAWHDSVGVEIRRGSFSYRDVLVCNDGNGGAYVVWGERDGTPPRAQHVNAAGGLLWAADGAAVTNAEYMTEVTGIARSFNAGVDDGLLVSMTDDDAAGWNRAAVQKLTLDGAPVWGDTGAELCAEDMFEAGYSNVVTSSDGSGGAVAGYTVWDYAGSSQSAYHVERVAADDSRPWGVPCGLLLADSSLVWPVAFAPTVRNNVVEVIWLDRLLDTTQVQQQRIEIGSGTPEYQVPRELNEGIHRYATRVKVIALGGGATATVWELSGYSTRQLWYQMHDAFGTPRFAEGGRILLDRGTGGAVYDDLCAVDADGQGGFFVALLEEVQDQPLRILHRDRNGEPVGEPTGEVLVYPNTYGVDRYTVHLMADGAGGVYVTMGVFDQDFIVKTYLERLDGECRRLWADPVIRGNNADHYPQILGPAANHSVIVASLRYTYTNSTLSVMRVRQDGTVAWDVDVASNVRVQSSRVSGCSDHQGGAVLAWVETPVGGTARCVAQRVGPGGVRLWGQGLVLADSSSLFGVSCDVDMAGNATIAWEQYRESSMDIAAQRVNAAGVALWPDGGLPVAELPFDQDSPQVVALSDNEVYVLWRDNRNSSQYYWFSDLYGTHLNARGEVDGDSYWLPGGSIVCSAEHTQNDFSAVNDGAGGLTVAWLDQRGSFAWDHGIYAQRLYDPIFTEAAESPTLPTEFNLAQNYPNPFNPETVIEFALPKAANTLLKVYDLLGREVATLADAPLEAGVHRVAFNGKTLASGVYFYRIEAGDFRSVRKMVLMK
ncbi:MAG: T9SS type A sorting domain-containing protein [bacterium]|nr:T9SS type A sorting domain-containing protein [bacterium]